MLDKLRSIEERFEALETEMGRPEIVGDYQRLQALAKERASLETIVTLYRDLYRVEAQIADARALAGDGAEPDLVHLAHEELATLEPERERLQHALQLALLPTDPHDERNVIVEIRAGTGGEEASLFAGDLYRMYARYAEAKGWQTDVLSTSETDRRGFKEIVFAIQGRGAFSRLKFESGGHRVQRVPETEAQGRIHTSTATVAVLSEADEVEIDVDEKDLRVDIYHAGSAGGQNVNKVASAVRITHLPTGVVAQCQDERSQLKNRTKAMNVLRARLLAIKEQEQAAQISDSRRSQVGSGERAEKIRTYNFPQDRVTDHRVDYTRHNLPAFLGGRIDDVIDAVATAAQTERLEASFA